MGKKTEILWAKIKKAQNYEISTEGEVRNLQTQKVRSFYNSTFGFYVCKIWENNNIITIYPHREMAIAFIPNPNPKICKYVMHKNEDRKDNRLSNLFWASKLEVNRKSLQTYIKNGRKMAGKNFGHRVNSTISHEEEKKIMKRLKAGETGANLALEYNVSEMAISRIRKKMKSLEEQGIKIEMLN